MDFNEYEDANVIMSPSKAALEKQRSRKKLQKTKSRVVDLGGNRAPPKNNPFELMKRPKQLPKS